MKSTDVHLEINKVILVHMLPFICYIEKKNQEVFLRLNCTLQPYVSKPSIMISQVPHAFQS